MIRRLLILAFLITVGANSVGAVSPHMDGDGCAMACCKAARQTGPDSAPARLRCLVDCNQPAGTSTSSGTEITFAAQKKAGTNGFLVNAPETLSYIQHARFPKSPTRFLAGCTDRYLETGTLLI